MSPERSFARHMPTDSWRHRLEETQAHYHEAQARYRKLLEEQPDGASQDPNGAVALARKAETEALAEYTRVLRAFTDLSVKGKIPEERSGAGSEGV